MLLLDRGFPASFFVGELHERGGLASARPWAAINQGQYPKSGFELDLEAGTATCPAG